VLTGGQPGQLIVDTSSQPGQTLDQGDVLGNGAPDFTLILNGSLALSPDDFVL